MVKWDDVETEDFTRFCQFAYVGDYSPPKPQEVHLQELSETAELKQHTGFLIDQQSEESPPPPPPPPPVEMERGDEPPADNDWWAQTSSKKKKKGTALKKSKLSQLRRMFASRMGDDIRARLETSYKVVVNNSPQQDFTSVFLGHVRLYILGDKYGIEDLTTLVLYKLHKTLIAFSLHEDRIVDVLQLIRYTYEHAPQQSTDPLRTLVTEYVAAEIDIIGKSVEFHALLEEGGEFVTRFWKVIQHHLL